MAAVAVCVLAACDKSADTTAPSTPEAGVHLAEPLLQDRLDATRRLLTVPLTNGGPGDAQVKSIQLVAPHFAQVPPTVVDGTLEPGRQINFSIAYGKARCDAKDGAVTLVLATGAGEKRLDVPRPVKILDRLRALECDQDRLAAAFTVAWDGAWTQVPASGGADRLRGALRLTRTGDEAVEVTDLAGSVLFDLDTVPPGRDPAGRLDGDNRTAEVPVEIAVRLCHKHGLTEAKRIFEYTLYARLGAGDPVYRTIIPPPEAQQRILALLKTCPREE